MASTPYRFNSLKNKAFATLQAASHQLQYGQPRHHNATSKPLSQEALLSSMKKETSPFSFLRQTAPMIYGASAKARNSRSSISAAKRADNLASKQHFVMPLHMIPQTVPLNIRAYLMRHGTKSQTKQLASTQRQAVQNEEMERQKQTARNFIFASATSLRRPDGISIYSSDH
ncbi:hypothetical protein AAP_01672 [Ascosphaera apis ARSEF 7405]|uniref:Uncharacterized protein n=1 Tax=Ascosphaera apis ARSEF 7405 TaxID=392613 RepID=A0A168BE09_9EURO|nr:hypothetical protein AAP_01672 [Ascosphaera apis ARSEF 7405]